MLKSFGVRGKILSICILLATFTLAVGSIGYLSLTTVTEAFGFIVDRSLPKSVALGGMNSDLMNLRLQINTLLIKDLPSEIKDNAHKSVEDIIKRFDGSARQYNELPYSQGEEELFRSAEKNWKSLKSTAEELSALYAIKTEDAYNKMLHIRTETWPKVADLINTDMAALIELQAARSKIRSEEARESERSGIITSQICVIIGVITALILGFIFSTALGRSLRTVAESLASGATVVASASQQLNGAGSTLSSSATEQAAALQETVASVDEISAMITRNSEAAARSQQVATISQDSALKGKKSVDDMIESMAEIDQANLDIMRNTEQSNHEISEIVKVIAEIGNKTKVINDIVFQTKLLSFNASVEAARAGEHGKGFAVVAEEVGNLAQMSGNAAQEISSMLDSSIRKVEDIVGRTKTSVETLVRGSKAKVERGSQTAANCAKALDELVNHAGELNRMVSEIANSSKEQASGIQEITKAMGALDEVTHRNAAAAEQSAGAATELDQQAKSVQNLVNQLMEIVDGKGEDSGPISTYQAPTPSHQTQGRVIPLASGSKASKRPVQTKPALSFKKAVGSDALPSADDPRFQDV